MKILAISDMYLKTEFCEACFAHHPEYELTVVKFGTDDYNDMREKFHHIERHGPEAVAIPEEAYAEIEDADVLMVHICPVPAALIARGKKLRAILTNRGGLENIAVEEATKRGIPILNNPAHNANGVAELAVGLMVTETRNIARAHLGLVNGVWREDFLNKSNIWELRGKTVGIVSYGAIAHHLVRMLQPFRVNIKLYDIKPIPEADKVRYNISEASLEEVFSTCDIVTVHTPLNEHTHHLIGEELLSLLPEDALFVNTSRGAVVDQAALERELASGRFRAFLDVYEKEPLPAESRLYDLPNVILMPHMGGPTVDLRRDITRSLLIEASEFLKNGAPLPHEITRAAASMMSRS